MQFMVGYWTPTGLRQVKRVILSLKTTTTRSGQGLEKQLGFLCTTPTAATLHTNSNLYVENTRWCVSSRNLSGVAPPSLYDQIGPADPISNIRPILFHIPKNESSLHLKYRLLRQDTHMFNHNFWAKHNKEFTEGREQYVVKVMREKYPHDLNKKTISVEEMSQFYKNFLDSQWSAHLKYNVEWQKRNFKIAALACLVGFENIFRKA